MIDLEKVKIFLNNLYCLNDPHGVFSLLGNRFNYNRKKRSDEYNCTQK